MVYITIVFMGVINQLLLDRSLFLVFCWVCWDHDLEMFDGWVCFPMIHDVSIIYNGDI